ncbi:T9SS type A sorting domain-containing protein [Carboxylicivirga marina]|uniref:T9SS type A sorting domain-containing protein n=1 Tax=Carboxylicivirga marina TaxID=2800988 RepID=A0ABS1HIG3_9BACT|nr:T9SS type A sorting domain-containing protein [Carboxylicivirga marina]MBK3517093.1 T9SS type A sorting domain-containing protein [Carboxylicivirga marina]
MAKNYYVSNNGNDSNDGLSEATPWLTLAKVNEAAERANKDGYLEPGDKILFRKGDTFVGQLILWCSGTEGNPIEISSYGEGELPILTGVGANLGNNNDGDAIEVVKITNANHLLLTELWITNDRQVGLGWQGSGNSSYGILVKANKWGGISQGLTFRNLKITDVFGVDMIDWEGKFTLDYYNAKGIFFDSNADEDGVEVGIHDVLIEDCYFYNLGSTAISARNLNPSNNPVSEEGRNQNFVIRNNTFEQLGGDGVVFASVCNGLVENNEFIDLGWGDHTSSSDRYYGRGEGCWIWDSHNIIVQYNNQYRARGFGDTYGAAGHIDFFCKNSIFQYNYSEDTEGGFVEILGDCENSVFRYNVSVNDGHRANGHHRYTIWLSGYVGKDQTPVPSDENYIYNNTVYLDNPQCKPDISIFAEDTYIYNNIFYTMNGAQIGSGGVEIEMQNGGELNVSNNLFYGNIAAAFSNLDAAKVNGDPHFTNPVSADGNPDNFNIQATSASIDEGMTFPEPEFPMAGQGIFENMTLIPAEDIFGNAMDIENLVPNIGASNAHSSNSQVGIEDLIKVSDLFRIYPNPVRNILNIQLSDQNKGVSYSIYSIQGQLIQSVNEPAGINELRIDLPSNAKNGIYFIRIAQGDYYQVERFVIYR